MGKRRKAGKKCRGGSKGSAARNMNHSGGGSNNRKFSAFEFDDKDLLVEVDDRKTLAKFGVESPSRKPVNRRKSIDKYDFLECFAQGITIKQNHSGNDVLVVDSIDDVSQDRTSARDTGISFGSLNYEPGSLSSLECQFSHCKSGAKSRQATRKTGRHTPSRKHNKTLHLDPDGDERSESGSLGSPINIGENKGFLKEQSSDYGATSNDCEAMVVVAPHYVKYGNFYYTNCRLTFARRCITFKGSPLCDGKRTLCFEWPTIDILNIEHQQCKSANAEVIYLYLRYKDANADETGSVELEFIILDDPQWHGKLEQIKSLDVKYEAAWKSTVSECAFDESFEEVVYPDGDPDAVIISRRDIELLKPGTFINDTIIDFYMKYLLNKTEAKEQNGFHFFNTFFFQKLYAARQDLSRVCRKGDAFRSVCKWTRNVNIFGKDYIFLPVNFSLHWSLIIICHPGEVANLRNKYMDEPSKMACILHMDSLKGSHNGLENLIRSYLWEEWKVRGNKQEADISVKFLNLDFVSLQLPQQENFSDCGLFLLHYAELFLELASRGSTTKYTDFLNKHWFHPAEVTVKKRDHIRKLIYRLIEDNTATSNNENGTREGEISAKSTPKNSLKETCCGSNFYSGHDFDVTGQQRFIPMEQRNIGKSRKINEFDNSCLPVEAGGSPKMAFCLENDKSSDLAACVVADSEDESEAERIRRTRYVLWRSSTRWHTMFSKRKAFSSFRI